jgi:hypothetical protein
MPGNVARVSSVPTPALATRKATRIRATLPLLRDVGAARVATLVGSATVATRIVGVGRRRHAQHARAALPDRRFVKHQFTLPSLLA